jgi:NADPH2:quinone reductase
MEAIQIDRYGDAAVLKHSASVPAPSLGAGQALVRIHAAGVNFMDIYLRRGRGEPPLPLIPGGEASGVVEAIADGVTDARVGDRVCFITGNRQGGYAQYAAIDADRLIPLPDDLSFEQGAAFPLQGITAHYLVYDYRKIKPGDTVLIHAAAGGVGLLLVQWVKHLGATVIGTVSTFEKSIAARKAGADHVIQYTNQDFVVETNRLTNGKGADLILDGVAKTTFSGDLEAAADHGHVVIFGSASGPADPFVANTLMARSLSVSGGLLMTFIATRVELLRRSQAVIAGLREGWLHLRIDQALPLADAEKAHRLLEGRQTMGKIVLRV